jgi:hypothetical protein
MKGGEYRSISNMKWAYAILFPILLAGCAQPTAVQQESIYRVEISASADRLAAGETVTVTGTIVGAYENPRYYITVTDQTASASVWKITLHPGNVIAESTGESAILELVSTKMIADTLTVVFRGRAAGSAAVEIGVVGKIGKMDASGRWQYDYTSRYSDPVTLSVH